MERFDPAWRLEVSVTDGWWYQGDPAQPEWRPAGAYLTPGEPQQAFDDRMRRLIALLQDLGGGDDDDDGTRRLGCDSAELPVDGGGIALCCHSEVIFALTGRSVRNCECVELRTSQLPKDPHVQRD